MKTGYVMYKFSEDGKMWFQYLDNNGVIRFSKHQTTATHFITAESAQECINDLKRTMRVNLTIEEAHT
jgi:hypothetical protein